MPPSILSSEALVIWMFRIAMKAPIMAANTEIQTAVLGRSGLTGAAVTARGEEAGDESARSDIASPFSASPIRRGDRDLRRPVGVRSFGRMRQRRDGRDHGHARAQLDRRRVERNF